MDRGFQGAIGTYEKSSLIVPNTELISGGVRNRTLGDSTQQLRITLLLYHDSEPRKVKDIALRVIEAHESMLKQPPPALYFMKVTE